MNAGDYRPEPKVAAGGLAGAAALVLVWVAGLFGLDVPPEVAAAVVLLAGSGVAYFLPRRSG